MIQVVTYDYNEFEYRRNRNEVICELCRDRKVLHVGAADAPYTRQKLKDGLLLHKQLMGITDEIYGIDNDTEAIAILKDHGISTVHEFDMDHLGDIFFSPEVIVMGELIEHLQNLKVAFSNIKKVMTADTKLIISTPNMLYVFQFLNAFLRHKEGIHDDHKAGFTYATLRHLLEANGMLVDTFFFTFLPRTWENLGKKIIRSVCRLRPGVSETLLVVAKLSCDDDLRS